MAVLVVEKGRLLHNLSRLLTLCGNSLVLPMIKADGYGLGTEWLVRTLAEEGIKQFAAARLEDALLIRRLLPDTTVILVSCYEQPDAVRQIVAAGITPAVGSAEGLRLFDQAADEKGVYLSVHLKLDTGMGRFGFSCDRPGEIYNMFNHAHNIQISGTFTHFSRCFGGKKNDAVTRRQLALFTKTAEALRALGCNPGFLHAANSVAALTLPETRLNGVRVGSALLGRCFGAEAAGLKSVGKLEADILCLRELQKDVKIGYGGVYKTRRTTKVAVINAGNADGFALKRDQDGFRAIDFARQAKMLVQKALGKKSLFCTVNGHTAPILGRISLCSLSADVSDIECKAGDKAVFEVNPLFCGGVEKRYE